MLQRDVGPNGRNRVTLRENVVPLFEIWSGGGAASEHAVTIGLQLSELTGYPATTLTPSMRLLFIHERFGAYGGAEAQWVNTPKGIRCCPDCVRAAQTTGSF